MSNSDLLTSDEGGEFSDGSDERSDDESMIQVRRNKGRNKAVIDSDEDDEEEEEEEERAFSPRTRMSITGVRPKDLTDDSSEIDYTDEDEDYSDDGGGDGGSGVQQSPPSAARQFVDRSAVAETIDGDDGDDNGDDDDDDDDEVIEDSQNGANSFVDLTVMDSDKSNSKSRSDVEMVNDAERKLIRVRPQQELLRSPAVHRYSANFAHGISENLSSTIYQSHDDDDESSMSSSVRKDKSHGDDSDVEVVSYSNATIELSSDESHNKENSMPPPAPHSVRTPRSKLIQPKIATALGGGRRTPAKEVKYVSQEFYDKEVKKLDEMKLEMSHAAKLLGTLGHSLPDGGRQIELRIERLSVDIKVKTNYLSTLRIDDGSQLAAGGGVGVAKVQQQEKKPFFNMQAPDWDELSAAVNKIQPIHTGKQGMATFNNEKALTVDRLKDLHGSLETRPGEDVLADDPDGLRVKLMNHQKHALAWMTWREGQKPRGGILADDMGLGKTLTMISLVLARKNSGDGAADDGDDVSDQSGSDTEKKSGWSSKGRRDYYQGGTLVVCPASLLRQWENEADTKLSRNKLTVCVHHGNNRDTKPRHLRTYDIVVTTYNIVSREHANQGCLFGIKWQRIILDEAHNVRNHKSLSSLAACALRGKYRWALTGTPIQNKAMDAYALLKFLRCTPFDDLGHWKRWIDKSGGGQERLNTVMTTLMLRRTKVQLQEYGTLKLPNKRIELIEVELDKEEMNVYQKIMIYSRTLFAQFLYQRAERNTDMMYRDQANLPTYKQSADPNGAYYKIHEKLKKLHREGGREQIKSHQILVLLLRLRQICCHPGLIDAMLEEENAQAIENDDDDADDDHEIDLLEQLNKLAIQDTSNNSSTGGATSNDSAEEQIIAKASAKVLQRSNPVFDFNRPSSKMNIVLKTLKQHVLNGSDKAIVVSQWTSVLNILQKHLKKAGVNTLSLNGAIAVKDRQGIVTEFNSPHNNKRVLLLSLTAGGVGLNLIGANHLFLIDLHWNPQLEAQAQDRIYRVGQKKDVTIYKFMCKDTVEERIKALQDHKLNIANEVLTGAKAAKGSVLSIDDLKTLFGM